MIRPALQGTIKPIGKTAMHLDHDISEPPAPAISFDQFLAVDIRIGTIVKAETFPEARKPAYKLSIAFGPTLGTKRSSAQITAHYTSEELVGRQVAAVVNFPPRQIGKFMSEVLTRRVFGSERRSRPLLARPPRAKRRTPLLSRDEIRRGARRETPRHSRSDRLAFLQGQRAFHRPTGRSRPCAETPHPASR
jgi:tRNA-binding protein